ncbi:MAG: hypothetical protein ACHP7N_02175 [Caulobacterales bacterium]
MAEASFEMRLERMFSDAPVMRDGELFTLRVLDRLDRGWTARRLLIGTMGLAGGMIGSVQILGSGVVGQLQSLGAQSNQFVNHHLVDALPNWLLPAGVQLNAQVIWMSVGLAVVAAGLGLARVIREI